jgi:hypothetical protein
MDIGLVLGPGFWVAHEERYSKYEGSGCSYDVKGRVLLYNYWF